MQEVAGSIPVGSIMERLLGLLRESRRPSNFDSQRVLSREDFGGEWIMSTMPFEKQLAAHGGNSTQTFLFRQAEKEDFSAIMALQDIAAAAVPKEKRHTFVLLTKEELTESLAEDFCVTVWASRGKARHDAQEEAVLAAFSLVVLNRITDRNLGTYLGYDREQLLRTVTYDTTFVHPDFRGFGLQRIIIGIKSDEALRRGASQALATVSPDNAQSMANTLAMGFEVAERRPMYGGLDRCIMRRILREEQMPQDG